MPALAQKMILKRFPPVVVESQLWNLFFSLHSTKTIKSTTSVIESRDSIMIGSRDPRPTGLRKRRLRDSRAALRLPLKQLNHQPDLEPTPRPVIFGKLSNSVIFGNFLTTGLLDCQSQSWVSCELIKE